MKLSEFAKECRDTWKEDRSGVPVVGLEHLEPGEVKLSIWDVDSENTFTKRFNKGQVLLGRRRVYLRKAVVAPFDGICSGDITVIEAIPGKILPELLPFVIQNDAFFDYAEQGSAGSLSPRVKWEHLKDFEVNLPSIDEQKVLAEKLWAAYRLKESYKKLLAATDEMVKSRFIEMFEAGQIFPRRTLIETCLNADDIKCGPFGTQLKQSEYKSEGVAVWGIPQINSNFRTTPDVFVTKEKAEYLESYSIESGDIAVSRKGNVGQCAIYPTNFDKGIIASDVVRIRLNKNIIRPIFLQYQLHNSVLVKKQVLDVSSGSIMAGINVSKLKNIHVCVPPISLQDEFLNVVEQADKSGFELRKSIENINAVIKSLINN